MPCASALKGQGGVALSTACDFSQPGPSPCGTCSQAVVVGEGCLTFGAPHAILGFWGHR